MSNCKKNLLFWPKHSAAGEKMCNILINGGIIIFFVTTFSNKRVWYRNSTVMRATLLFTVSNGNKVSNCYKFFLYLSNGSNVTSKFFNLKFVMPL